MIRFVLRQFRTQGLVALAALVALAVLAMVTGPHLVHLYDTTIVACQRVGDCGPATAALTAADGHLSNWLGALVLAVPAILGVFWGAPLIARELETGTFRMVWTQSVTRTRWLAVKLCVVGVATIVVAGLTSLIVTLWASPIDKANGGAFDVVFDERNIVPVAYAAFAFALGVAVGLVVRRTLVAMAATVAGFVAVRFPVAEWVRPYLASPLRIVSSFRVPSGPGGAIVVGKGLQSGDWVLSEQTLDRSGHVLANGLYDISIGRGGYLSVAGQRCPASDRVTTTSQATVVDAVRRCAAGLHLRQVITYQPRSRYWPFQWEESALFMVLAGLLVAFCLWWLLRTYNGRGQGSRPTRLSDASSVTVPSLDHTGERPTAEPPMQGVLRADAPSQRTDRLRLVPDT